MAKSTDSEQWFDASFTVKIRTFGKPSKHADGIGQTLAQLCSLNFQEYEIRRGKTTYEHVVKRHPGGAINQVPPALTEQTTPL